MPVLSKPTGDEQLMLSSAVCLVQVVIGRSGACCRCSFPCFQLILCTRLCVHDSRHAAHNGSRKPHMSISSHNFALFLLFFIICYMFPHFLQYYSVFPHCSSFFLIFLDFFILAFFIFSFFFFFQFFCFSFFSFFHVSFFFHFFLQVFCFFFFFYSSIICFSHLKCFFHFSFSSSFFLLFFLFPVVRADTKTRKKSSRSSHCEKDDVLL